VLFAVSSALCPHVGWAQATLPVLSPSPHGDPIALAPTTAELTAAIESESLPDLPPDLNYIEPDKPLWYYPWVWVPLDGWTNSAELGMNGSSGNAKSFSFQAGTRFKRKTEINLFDLRLTHNRTVNNGTEKQNNALMYHDLDRYFGESRWSAFVKNGLEYDRFKAFDLRYNINVGLGYSWIKRENLTLKGRFGSGTSREFGGPEDRWVMEALFGGDYEHQWNKRNKWIARIDYFPEWADFGNYRIVSDVSWELLWDEIGNLSLKVGAMDRYDSTPGGRQPNDVTYSMLLLYKF
jgi:putative salt-induced outer membrane protein YdiY